MPVPITLKIGIGPPPSLLDSEPAIDNSPGAPKLWVGINGVPTVIADPSELDNYLPLTGGNVTGATTINTLVFDVNGMGCPTLGGGQIGFTWNGSAILPYVNSTPVGPDGLTMVGPAVKLININTDTGWNPKLDIPNFVTAAYSVVNQIGAAGWPDGMVENTGFIIAGYNSNPAWKNKILMAGRYLADNSFPMWVATNTGVEGAETWHQVITSAGGTIKGNLSVHSNTGIWGDAYLAIGATDADHWILNTATTGEAQFGIDGSTQPYTMAFNVGTTGIVNFMQRPTVAGVPIVTQDIITELLARVAALETRLGA